MKNPLTLVALLLVTLLAGPAGAAPPTVPATLDALGLHLTLDDDAQRLVQTKVNSLYRHQPAFEARVALAGAAFPLIDRVLAAEGVPVDFRYLAVQESALRGDAASPHGAVGYWQLKRETALSLGLTVNESVDERQHLAASTRAAARYLAGNHAELRNWLNALLSYYLGPNGVRAYVQARDPDATAMALTGQSNPYLFDFLAHKIAFEPALAAAAPPANAWREVPAGAGQTLDQQAAELGADPNALAALNSWLLAAAVPADGRAYTWVVAAPAPPSPASPAPPVAEQPAPTPAPASAPPAPPAPADPAPGPVRTPAATTPHSVIARETLYGLARQLGVRPAELALVNHLPPNALLRVGQLLQLPPAGPDAPYLGSYVVGKGDTLFNLARRFGCSVDMLQAHNARPGGALRVGETLRVPAP